MTENTERTEAPPGPGQRTARQRRPTGAPPPLPHPITVGTTAWLLVAAVILAGAIVISQSTPWRRADDHVNTWLLRQLAEVRTPWLTDIATGIKAAGTGWGIAVGLSVVVLTMVFRRWRHLLVFLGSLFFLEIVVGNLIYYNVARPRPYGVLIIGTWGGYAAPSIPVAAVTIFLMGAVYCLVVPGRPRSAAKAAVIALVAVFCLARLYLAVDHPDDVLFGVALGVAVPVAAFRYFTPNEVFPVAYRRGRTAHVDVGGRRGKAIQAAIRDRLGLTVLEIKPVGLESSAGSTPLRLRVEGGPDEYLFAKLYTKGHVRADRWYDLGNMMLVLAVRSDPDRVYQRALRYFTPAELAEAFAATRGVASPTQLRAFMKRDPRDLLGTFRALAPPREPIALQRWSLRRVGLAVTVLAVTVIALSVGAQAFRPVGDIGVDPPLCGTGNSIILAAQAVPSAALVPCVAALPSGWQVGGADIATGHSRFWLDSDQAGAPAVTITLSAACDMAGARPVPSDQPGARRFERQLSQRPQFAALRFYVFPGGCVTYQFSFVPGASPLLAIPVNGAVGFVPRARLVDHIKNTEGLALCGRGAPCPG